MQQAGLQTVIFSGFQGMVMTDDPVACLKAIGWNEYEARTYVALIGMGEGTARMISELSGVPRGKIYHVLNALVRKGYLDVQHGTPTRYAAVAPEEVLGAIRDDFNRNLNQAVDALKRIGSEYPHRSLIWSLHSEWAIKNRVRQMIGHAEHEIIVLSAYPEYLRQFTSVLKEAAKRCDLSVIVDDRRKFTGMRLPIHEVPEAHQKIIENYVTDYTADEFTVKGDLTLVIDRQEWISVMRIRERREAVTSTTPAMVRLLMGEVIEMLNAEEER
ncbi:helix-turn-helix domain-containing protein [Methanofollis sp. W23]|uniref:TrmB family transcriptional regulator n=1 Tax=Methanofollis sp. W23 TaxID=2817849 RepID=UPI001AE667C6|nr:helix-turn-helix domain-containing protein [Methanofollis sp. W23]